MEISPTAESSIVMGEENSWHIGGEEYTVRLTPLENWQQAVELVLDFVQEMLDEIAMYDQPKEDGWQLTRTYPFIVRKHVDDGRQPPPGLVTEEERTTLLRRFAAFFKGKSVQTWQMHASKFPHDKEKDYTFGIFHEHVLFAVEGKRYWLRAEFSD